MGGRSDSFNFQKHEAFLGKRRDNIPLKIAVFLSLESTLILNFVIICHE